MPRISDVYSSYLKSDVLAKKGGGYGTMQLTIKGSEIAEFDDGKKQIVLHFNEDERGLGLNKTNAEYMKEWTNSDDSDDWKGLKVELWVDTEVRFGGKKIPAIRIRKPGSGAAAGGNPFGDAPTTFGPAWADAMTAAAKKVNLTIDNIRKWLEDNDAAPLQTIASDPPNWPREWMPLIKKLIDQPSLAASSNSGAVRASSASDEQPDLGGEPEAPF